MEGGGGLDRINNEETASVVRDKDMGEDEDSVLSFNSRISLKSQSSRKPRSGGKVVPLSGPVASTTLEMALGSQGDGHGDEDMSVSDIDDMSIGGDDSTISTPQRSNRKRSSRNFLEWCTACVFVCRTVLCPSAMTRSFFRLLSGLPMDQLTAAVGVVLFSKYSCRSGLLFVMISLFTAFLEAVLPAGPQYNAAVLLFLLASNEYPNIPKGMRTHVLLSVGTALSILLDFSFFVSEQTPAETKVVMCFTLLGKLYTLMEVLTHKDRASQARKFLYRRLRIFGIAFTTLPYRLLRDIRYRILGIGIISGIGAVAYLTLFLVGITSLSLDPIVSAPATGIALSTFLLVKSFASFIQLVWILTDTDIVLFLGTFGFLCMFMKYYRAHVARRREELGGWPLVYAFNSLRVKILGCMKAMDTIFGIAGWVTLSTCTGRCFVSSPDNLQAYVIAVILILLLTDIWGSLLMAYIFYLMKELKMQRGSTDGGFDEGLEDSDDSELDELGIRGPALEQLSRRKQRRRQHRMEKLVRRRARQLARQKRVSRSSVKKREKTASYSRLDSSSSDIESYDSGQSSLESDLSEELTGDGNSDLLYTENGISERHSVDRLHRRQEAQTDHSRVRRRSPHSARAKHRDIENGSDAPPGITGAISMVHKDRYSSTPKEDNPVNREYDTAESPVLSPVHMEQDVTLHTHVGVSDIVGDRVMKRPDVEPLDLSKLTQSYSSLVKSEMSNEKSSQMELPKSATNAPGVVTAPAFGNLFAKTFMDASSSDSGDDKPVRTSRSIRRPLRREGTTSASSFTVCTETPSMEMELFSSLWEQYQISNEVCYQVSLRNRKLALSSGDRVPLAVVMDHLRRRGLFIIAFADYDRVKNRVNKLTPGSSTPVEEFRTQTARLFSVSSGNTSLETVYFLLEVVLLFDTESRTNSCMCRYKCKGSHHILGFVENLELRELFKIY